MREIRMPAPSEVPLEPIIVDGGYQLNVLLPHRDRAPRGWRTLIEDTLQHGQAMSEDGLRLWVRSKRLGQLQHILNRALSFPWGSEIGSHFFVRYFVQTAFYAVDRPLDQVEESSSDVLPLTKALGFVPTDELLAQAKRLDEARVEIERALADAAHQRFRTTGKQPTADELEHFKAHGEWPEALPSAPEHLALTEGGNE